MSKFETEMKLVRAGNLSRIHIAIDEFNNFSIAEQQRIFNRLQDSDENIRRFYKLFMSLNIYNDTDISCDVANTFIEFLGELAFPGYQFNTKKYTNGFASVSFLGNLPSYYTYDFETAYLPKMMEVKKILRAIFNNPDKKTLNRMKLFFVAYLADAKTNNETWIMRNKENGGVTFIC